MFSIRCNQSFRPLRTSTSNIYLNFSLNPNGLLASSLALSRYIRIILDTPHDSRYTPAEVSASDQARPKPTYSSGMGGTNLLLRRSSSFSSAVLTFLKIKLTSAQGRNPSYIQQSFHLYSHQVILEGDMLHASTSR